VTKSERVVAIASSCGVIGSAILGLACALMLLTHRGDAGSLAASPAIDSQIGTVSVIVGDNNKPPPAVLTTEQLADEIGVNADTVRRRYASDRLFGFEKLDRDAWVRIGHGACMLRACDVHASDMGI